MNTKTFNVTVCCMAYYNSSIMYRIVTNLTKIIAILMTEREDCK